MTLPQSVREGESRAALARHSVDQCWVELRLDFYDALAPDWMKQRVLGLSLLVRASWG